MLVIEHPKDPISVSLGLGRRIILRIGRRKRGETRLAVLGISEARVLGYALLSQAEDKDEEIRKMNEEVRQFSRPDWGVSLRCYGRPLLQSDCL